MEIKDIVGPLVTVAGLILTFFIYAKNNQRERKKEFADLRAAMERDKQTEIEKVREDADKSLKTQRHFDEQMHEIATLKNDIRNHEETHKELRSDLHDIKDVLNQVLQKMAVLEQGFKQKTKGIYNEHQ